jgi:hypothetical protein
LFVFAQLRDMLAAEDSSIVPQENDDRGFAFPERAQANFPFIGIGQNDVRKLLAKRFFHGEQ